MRRLDLVQKVTVGVMGAAIVLIELLWGHLANPVLLMLGLLMLGLPYFLHSEPKPQPAKLLPGEVVLPVRSMTALAQAPERLTTDQRSVEARLRRFPKIGTEQRMHLARTLDPAIVQLDDDAIRQRLGAYGTLTPDPAPASCGYCTPLRRRCACRR